MLGQSPLMGREKGYKKTLKLGYASLPEWKQTIGTTPLPAGMGLRHRDHVDGVPYGSQWSQ